MDDIKKELRQAAEQQPPTKEEQINSISEVLDRYLPKPTYKSEVKAEPDGTVTVTIIEHIRRVVD